jgi:hypothetical protein
VSTKKKTRDHQIFLDITFYESVVKLNDLKNLVFNFIMF